MRTIILTVASGFLGPFAHCTLQRLVLLKYLKCGASCEFQWQLARETVITQVMAVCNVWTGLETLKRLYVYIHKRAPNVIYRYTYIIIHTYCTTTKSAQSTWPQRKVNGGFLISARKAKHDTHISKWSHTCLASLLPWVAPSWLHRKRTITANMNDLQFIKIIY